MKDPYHLIWIDLEMTGLSPETDHIILWRPRHSV